MSTTTVLAPARGADVITITRSLEAWEKKRGQWRPAIVTVAWRGTRLDPKIERLWGRVYAWSYPGMLQVGVMADLCEAFKGLGFQFLAGNDSLVLDAGTGSGWMARALLDLLPTTKVICADWCPHFLRQAQANLTGEQYRGRVSLWRVDLTEPWPWPRDCFDAVVANYVLPYLPLEAQIALLKQARDALRPGGFLLVNYMRAGFTFKDAIRPRLLQEFLARPLAFLRALPIMPTFTMKVDRARRNGLIHDFSDDEFVDITKGLGYRGSTIVGEKLDATVPIWKLVK